MKDSIKDENASILYTALLSLKTEEECAAFLKDLCTDTEINAMSQRFVVAKMINDGKKYDEIELQTGASPATISRVKRYMTNYEKYKIFERIQ